MTPLTAQALHEKTTEYIKHLNRTQVGKVTASRLGLEIVYSPDTDEVCLGIDPGDYLPRKDVAIWLRFLANRLDPMEEAND